MFIKPIPQATYCTKVFSKALSFKILCNPMRDTIIIHDL